jgi:hypothetical protein
MWGLEGVGRTKERTMMVLRPAMAMERVGGSLRRVACIVVS